MTPQSPDSNDPLATLAKATQKAVRSADASRAAEIAAKEKDAAGRRRIVRAAAIAVVIAIAAAILVVQVPRMVDPYTGVDPLSEPQQAKAYVAGLLDAVMEWRMRHGFLPTSLEQAIPERRLLPAGSAYRLAYRIEDGVPVLALEGGTEPIVVRGNR
jgi:hypothetical protein